MQEKLARLKSIGRHLLPQSFAASEMVRWNERIALYTFVLALLLALFAPRLTLLLLALEGPLAIHRFWLGYVQAKQLGRNKKAANKLALFHLTCAVVATAGFLLFTWIMLAMFLELD